MHIKKVLHTWHQKINIPSKYLIVIGAVLFLAALYTVLFRERTIEYSYGGETCNQQVVFLPRLFHASGSSDYSVTTKGGIDLWGYPIVSTTLCIVASNVPSNDAEPVAISLMGNWLARIAYKVQVPDAPKASLSVFDEPISATKPVVVELSKPDETFAYSIHTDTTSAGCVPANSHLSCDIPALQLRQGDEYMLAVKRYFKDQAPETLANVSVKTLSPVAITSSSIAEGSTLYDKPTSVVFESDKPLKETVFEVVQIQGAITTSVPFKTSIEDKKVIVTFSEVLARSSQFIVSTKTFEANDGSTLADPYALRFNTSGGPVVKSVSASSAGLSQNVQIVVTFDQPIRDSVDITRFARLSGVTGSVRKQSATQIVFSVQNGPLCTAFSLIIDKGVQSASNDELSGSAWKFDSRIMCGSSSIIGYSVRGRPIIAYYFGTGATTILMTGGMHGSEPSGTTTMNAFVDYLQTQGYRIPSDKKIVIVPNTNPDAIAAGSRNNANNVNIDRNFPSPNWTSSIETASGTLPQGGGASAGSEPETQALIALTRLLRPRLEVSFHAQGRLVGANKVGDSVVIGDIYAGLVGYRTMFNNPEEVMGGYAMTGEYEDWMGEELGIPAILIELPSPSGNYLQAQLNALWRMITL